MRPIQCEFEEEVLAAAIQSRWPDRVDARLREHVHSCEICSDVVKVAGALDAARDEMRSTIVVPDSGRVWWLAQMRARREAAKTAGRPITAVQVIAFTCAIALLGACFGATSTWFQESLKSVLAGVGNVDIGGLIVSHGLLVLGMVAVVVLVPAAVYFAISKD